MADAQLFGVFTGRGLASGVVEADTAESALAYAEKCCANYGMRIVSGPDKAAGRYSVSLLVLAALSLGGCAGDLTTGKELTIGARLIEGAQHK